MASNICVQCGTVTSSHDIVGVASGDGAYRSLCSRCFSTEMALLAELHSFKHPEFKPVRLTDAAGVMHEFHFRSLLLGDRLTLEAFELGAGEEDYAGHLFQLLGDPQSNQFELLGKLVQKIKRALATTYLVERADSVELAGTMVRGRIESGSSGICHIPNVIIDGGHVNWTDFGAMLMQFEGWQFRIEFIDPSDEA